MQRTALNGAELQRRLAAYLLGVSLGQRLPSVRELAQAHTASVGSISNALNELEQKGAVRIDRRGHLGSYVVARDVGELWLIAEQGPLIISFPLPSSLLLEGLATGLKALIGRAGIDVYLTFIRGSRTRLKALRGNKCHIAVMSTFAADDLHHSSLETLLRLPSRTYVKEHMVFYRPRRTDPDGPLRVGIDWDSFDIHRLVELEFGSQEVQLKPVSYMQIPRLLSSDQIDAALWSIDDMEAHLGADIQARPLASSVQNAVALSDTAATLVVRSTNASVCAVLADSVDTSELTRIQKKVLAGELVPEY